MTLSYKDPTYDQYDRIVTAQLGLPEGLLSSIRTKGERSNADQVSEAGAKSVYQIIPSTRDAILRKYGVDAYLGPKQAALAAGHLLKESLNRNGGNQAAAAAEYHGGLDRRQWGRRTRAYVQRVTGQAVGSTYDRVTAARQASAEPSIAELYASYRSGRMPEAGKRQFEADVATGRVQLPRGATVTAAPVARQVEEVPADIIAAFNSGEMSEAGMRQLKEDVRTGAVKLPDGVSLTGPPTSSIGRSLALGAGDVAQGVGDLVGIVANPLNTILNATGIPQALTGSELGTDLGAAARATVGAPDPVTPSERLTSAIVGGGTQALATAGAAIPLATGRGVTRAVARTISESPLRDVLSGLTAGAGSEIGGNVAGAPGAIVGALAGGGVGLAAAAGGRRTAVAISERIADRFPRAAIVDEAGNLTAEGAEIVQRAGGDADAVVESYARRRKPVRSRPTGRPRPADERQAVRDAITPEQRERAALEAATRPDAPVSASTPPPDLEAGTQRIISAISDRVEQTPRQERTQRTLEAVADNVPGYDPDPLGDAATGTAQRFVRAQGEGVQLTRGQAERNFEVQNDENSLRVAASGEGEQARQFFNDQAERIKEATASFREGFATGATTAEERGAIVKAAVSALRDEGAEGVRKLYREAEALGGDGLRLETDGIKRAAEDVLINEAVPDAAKRGVAQAIAEYGLIGKAEPINEAGITSIVLDDGSSVRIRGAVKELSAANAEDMRQAINKLWDLDPTRSTAAIKPAIDDALEDALERAATSNEGAIGAAYKSARAAYREQRQTFKAKDIIENLIANKKGTETDVLLPERAIAQVIGAGKEGVSNLKKVKALLLSSSTDSSKQAWRAIQQQAVADILDQAVNVQTQTISGARLNSAINKFGVEKLKVILEPADFNEFMKLRRIIADATIPMSGTTNPSGTFTKLANFLGRGALRFTGGLGDAAMALVGKARELAATRKTLEGITSFDGRQATSQRLDQQARDFVEQYIADGKAGRLVPSAVQLRPPSEGQNQ